MKKTLKNIALSAILLSSLILSSCVQNKSNDEHSEEAEGHNHNEETEGMAVLSAIQRNAINLEVGTMPKRIMKGIVKTSGQLEVSPSNKAEVTAYIGGNVVSIDAFQGDKVQKGQVLATLEHPDIIQLQQDFIEKYNNLKYLQQEYDRQKELYQKEVGSGKQFQKVESEYNSAKAQYQGLKLRLQMLKLNTEQIEKGNIISKLNILSPISGYVSGMNISLGSYIDARTQMFSIRNFEQIHADLSVYEQDISKVVKGQTVRLKVANLPNTELTGKVFAVAKEYAPNSRTVVVHASINNPPEKLIADSYVSGEILTKSNKVNAVPENAIVTDGNKKYIFVFDANGSIAANHDEEAHEEEGEHNHSEADIHDHEVDEHDHDHNGEEHNHDGDHDHDGDEHNHDGDHNHNKEAEHNHDEADHNHDADEHHHLDNHEHHNAKELYHSLENDKMAFRMVEVITNEFSEGYVSITTIEQLSENDLIVLNGAYYLLSDLKKSEAAHHH